MGRRRAENVEVKYVILRKQLQQESQLCNRLKSICCEVKELYFIFNYCDMETVTASHNNMWLPKIFILISAILLFEVGRCGENQNLYCHSGSNAGLDITVRQGSEPAEHRILPFDRFKENVHQSRTCRWNVKLEADNAIILMELRRTDERPVQPGDVMPMTILTLTNASGSIQWKYPWNKMNFSLFRMKRDETVSLRIDNATAKSSNNWDLFFYLRIVLGPKLDVSTRYIVRTAQFMCGLTSQDNCSQLTALAAQFSSNYEIRQFVLNASTELKRYLTKPILLGLKCCNDSVMHYQEHGSTGNNTWKQVAGFEHSAVCNDIQPDSLVSLHINSSIGFQLAAGNGATDGGGVLIDLLRAEIMASPIVYPSVCDATQTVFKSDSDSKGETLLPLIALPLVLPVFGIFIGVLIYKKQKRTRKSSACAQIELEGLNTPANTTD